MKHGYSFFPSMQILAPIENIDAWQLGNETVKSFSFRKRWRTIFDVTLLWIYIINFFYKCQHVISVPTLLYCRGGNKPVLAYIPIFSLLSKVKDASSQLNWHRCAILTLKRRGSIKDFFSSFFSFFRIICAFSWLQKQDWVNDILFPFIVAPLQARTGFN